MARPRKQRVCASNRASYKWMRIDPCIEYYEAPEDVEKIVSSREVAKLFADEFSVGSRGVESFWVLGVDSQHRPMFTAELNRGGISQAVVEIPALFQTVLLTGAERFIVVHNHPSGEAIPSDSDLALTKRIKDGAKLTGLVLMDHIIVTYRPDRYYSFLDHGVL